MFVKSVHVRCTCFRPCVFTRSIGLHQDSRFLFHATDVGFLKEYQSDMGFVTYEWKNTKTKNKTVLSARCFKSFFFMVGPENCFKIKWLRWVFTPDVRLSLAKLSRLGHHALCRCSNSYQRVWQYHLFPKRMVQVNIHNGTERPIHRCFITPPSPPGLPPGCSASPQSLHWLGKPDA